MDNFKIILFLCNWGSHAAYQSLQDNGYRIPPEVCMVRIPCTGRITKALLFKAFEMGADGVALVGCGTGACRYGSGTEAAEHNTEDTRNIIGLLGLGRERMRHAVFLPDQARAMETFLAEFCDDMKKLGKSPIIPSSNGKANSSSHTVSRISLGEVVSKHDAYACQDCGKCTSSCPLALSGKEYSPRAIVNAIIRGNTDSEQLGKDIRSCLTCGTCYERCPSGVNFPEFVRDMRCDLHIADDDRNHQPHGGFFQSLMRSMTSPALKPDRWSWIPPDVRTDPESKVMFFGGCAPYFDAFFEKHQVLNTSDILSDALRLLNFFDIRPRLSDAERCCGHDLLWSGDRENFLRLAKLNVEMIGNLGIEKVITSCPECYKTLRFDYEAHGIKPDFEVVHLYEFLETEIDKGAIAFEPLDKPITYQDSCRLNRLESMREYPRKLIKRLGGKFVEMKDADKSALCCGNCAWTGCDSYSKALQVKRLRQAHETGSELMITSCPKCQIHLRCAMEDPFLGKELEMEMADLTCVIAKTICWD